MTQSQPDTVPNGDALIECKRLIDGKWIAGGGEIVPVLDKYSQQPCAMITMADRRTAVSAAKGRAMPSTR